MDAQEVHDEKARNSLLKDLLAPGIQHGWSSVGTLKLWVSALSKLMQAMLHDVGNSIQCRYVSFQGAVFLLTCRETSEPQPLPSSQQQPSQHCEAYT
jgi:metal-dependent HD superfamily phosphatase/phosphodiesterase